MPSRSIQAIAFDLDNTLIDRDAAFLHLMTDWVSVLAGKEKSVIEWIIHEDNHGYSDRDDFFLFLARMRIFGGNRPGLRNRFKREFPACFKPNTEIQQLLKRLRERRIELALLSNGGSTLQRGKLKHSSLTEYFAPDRILISEEIGFSKPDHQAFALLSENLETPPEDILFVGDHPELDIAGASACGFQTCWCPVDESVATGNEPPFDFKLSHILELESTCLT